ncbi:MAG: carboxyl transferase domain-containing protein [Lachnospiraceae bacterium]|nr:carboxyl transferase domain-containing protein [Lachnospiraceae bacterium]MDY5742026.1 carboxyl transferase domain-containing protein [Lachnospiraceae bacterium]
MEGSILQSPARSRILHLLDDKSFVEMGAAIRARRTNESGIGSGEPGDGVITGYGLIDGKPVYVYSQDSTVMGGTLGRMHAAKITRIYDLATKTGTPVVGLIDSHGFRLEESVDALQVFGEVYRKQAEASGSVLQIGAVFGECAGAVAFMAAMNDLTLMEADKTAFFINSPNAIPGSSREKLDTTTAAFQAAETMNVDMVADEAGVLARIRALVSLLPSNHAEGCDAIQLTDDLNRSVEELNGLEADGRYVAAVLADEKQFIELKSGFGEDMITGFMRLGGMPVGVLANNAVTTDADGETVVLPEGLSVRGLKKAVSLVKFCDAFSLPLVTLTNTKSFKASLCTEKQLVTEAAALISALAQAGIPKVNVVTGRAMGSAGLLMNSKALGADMEFAWPQARIGLMEAKLAAGIMHHDQSAAYISEQAALYEEEQNGAAAAAARGYVDQVIDVADTRKHLIAALSLLEYKRETVSFKRHSTK